MIRIDTADGTHCAIVAEYGDDDAAFKQTVTIYHYVSDDNPAAGTCSTLPLTKKAVLVHLRMFKRLYSTIDDVVAAVDFLTAQIEGGGWHTDDITSLLAEKVITQTQHDLTAAVFENSALTDDGLYPCFVAHLEKEKN